jgi:23S rRNA (adenine2503-C2)-methyltransferase
MARRESFFECNRTDLAVRVGSGARADRLYKAVYQGCGVSERDRFELEHFNLALPPVTNRFVSADGTRRLLLRLEDGELVESVLIPERGRFTFCVSSQLGCALACKFCLTGKLGLIRNLSAGEIVWQVLVQRAETPPSSRFSVVLMGMGEPLQNYDNVLKAIEILTDNHGLAMPLQRITLSTAGLVPALERLSKEVRFPNLSISLTGATNETRNELMPINQKYPIEDVIKVVRALPESRRKRVMFEYVMIKGVTDSAEDARCLSSLLFGLRAKVNLIPLNESPEIDFRCSEQSDILRFQEILLQKAINTFIRKTRGEDVYGACGQLTKHAASQFGERIGSQF